ncbi:MAG TPA: TonB-dependent receptor, partial [Fibrobacteraceae bacterium]|nr:TonB-dependent receptor [Fibrobacteraceae bacterium]
SPLGDSARWNSTLSWRFSDNDYSYWDRNGTAYNTADDSSRNRQNAQYSQLSGNHAWNRILPWGELRLQINHSQENGGYPGTESQITHVAGFDRQWLTSRLTWLQLPWNNGWRMEAELGGRTAKDLFHWSNEIDHLGYSTGNEEYQEIGTRDLRGEGALRFLGEWRNRYSLQMHLSGFGEQLDPRDNPAQARSWKWRLQRHSGTGALEASAALRSWLALQTNLQATGLIDHNSGGILRTTYNDTMPEETSHRWAQASQASLRLGDPASWWKVTVAGGHHYRLPELRELYSTCAAVLPNPDLLPEKGENAELGLELTGRKWRLQTSLFWNRSRNGIYWVYSAGFSKPQNLSRTETRGWEAECHFSPFSWLDWSAQMTWQDPRNTTNLAAYHNKLSPNEPRFSTGSEFSIRWGRCEFGVRGEWRSTVYRDMANQMRIAPQGNVHASLAVAAWTGATIRFCANNLTGAESQDIYSAYPTPGRQYSLGLVQEF